MKSQEFPRVVIGTDPHRRSVTSEVIDGDEQVLGDGTFATEAASCRSVVGSFLADRVWAIDGCNGIGRHIAHRLIAAGRAGSRRPAEAVRAGAGVATGQGRKPDATNVHSVVRADSPRLGLNVR